MSDTSAIVSAFMSGCPSELFLMMKLLVQTFILGRVRLTLFRNKNTWSDD